MLDLLITIALFNVLVILFKLFPKYKVDNLQALIFNYITAGILGFVFYKGEFSITQVLQANWLLHAIVIGVLFIIVFNFYAFGTQKVGVAISTVANKMSLVFPVVASLLLYPSETISIYKILGFAFSIIGIYLTSTKGGKLSFDKKYIWIILAIFVGQGIADIVFNDCTKIPGASGQTELIFVVLFFIAALVGVIMTIGKSVGAGFKFEWKNIFWGIAVGIPNYGTLYFMFKALHSSGLDSSEVYPIISMGAVLSSAIIGLLIFKEKISGSNWVGILFALLGIAIITFGKYIY
ncbi:MAG: DMT family transporter [Flavobacteriales bacterium]|nr:DMT family transporter [Flavobacteriales bacterium]